jgi:type IV pilus assembly protein PilY1
MNEKSSVMVSSGRKWLAVLRRWGLLLGIAGYSVCGTLASAGPLNLSDTPPFLTAGVPPNLIMAIDDSGSMDTEMLVRANDGSPWWITKNGNPNSGGGTCTNPYVTGSFLGCKTNGTTNVSDAGLGVLNYNHFFNGSAPWVRYAYLFPNGAVDSSNTSYVRRMANESVPPIDAYGWARANEINGTYFDPDQSYPRWINSGTFVFADSPPTAARPDPVFPTFASASGRFDLTKDIASTAGIGAGTALPVGVDPATLCSAINNTTVPYDTNYGFRVYEGMTLPVGTCFRVSGRNWDQVTSAAGCVVNGGAANCKTTIAPAGYAMATNIVINIRYFPATFYATAAGAPSAAFGYSAAPVLSGSKTPDGTSTDLYRYEIRPGNFSTAAQYTAAIQNFANWFTYYRKRHLALRAGMGSAFNTVNGMNVAGFTINSVTGSPPTGPNVNPVIIDASAAGATNRQNLYTQFYQTWVSSGGTPNRAAIANIVRNYKRASGPITNSCQRNFGMLFTDGFANIASVPSDGAAVGNVDGTATTTPAYTPVDPYKDTVAETMADRIMSAYSGADASAMLAGIPAPYNSPGLVRVPKACVNGVPPASAPWTDCNKNPHMNFYALTLGTPGLLFDPDIPNIEDPSYPYNNVPVWRTSLPPDRHASAIDDLWHAAINGRGQLFNARTATELSTKLQTLLNNVTDISGSAASAAVSSGTVSTSIKNRTFVVSFDPNDWSGSLKAKELKPDTTTGVEVDGMIPMSPTARKIITVNSNGNAVPFRWANLDSTRQTQLNAADMQGSARLDYLRGDRSNEKPAGLLWRKRSALTDALGVTISAPLGDIISAAPVYVGAPPFRYRDTLESQPYSVWAATKEARTPIVYVGSNDGMMHAFSVPNAPDPTDATNLRGIVDVSGAVTEEFAYIPGAVFKNLPELTKSNYLHFNYVDGTPSVIDAFFSGNWHTVLVGGLNKGGQGIYALDVTDPMSIDESTASSALLWEFTDLNDADLGYTFSRPAVVRLHNGEWGVVFGNGYGSDTADGHVGDGVATLFILRLSDGAKLAEIKLPSSPIDLDSQMAGKSNGLSTPAVVDIDGDDIVDAVYVGDLYGNMWKVDLSDSNPSNWKTAFGTTAVPIPLIVAKNTDDKREPITTRPQVARGPNGFGQVVLFGTGKYVEGSDKNTATKQSFYGVYDQGVAVTRAQLQQQTIVSQQPVAPATPTTRITSNTAVVSGKLGWYIDLIYGAPAGEMNITDSVLRNGRVAFTTLIPDNDPCKFGGKSWLMLLDALTGSRLTGSPFDLNHDNKFDTGDLVGGVPVSGVYSDSIMSQPRFVAAPTGDIGIVTKTNNDTDRFLINPGPGRVGRQSWRQLR